MEWDIIAALWVLGQLPSEGLESIATEALVAGLDTPSLRLLAAESDLHEARRLFDAVLDELGVPVPDRGRAGLVMANAYAAQIVDGTLPPYEGALRIWQIEVEVEGLMLELGSFVYWASEWQESDSDARRDECDTAIRTAAANLLAGE